MPFQTHNPRQSDDWTAARILLLLNLDAENKLSRAGIAEEMRRQTGCKFSRSAIIGKLKRLQGGHEGTSSIAARGRLIEVQDSLRLSLIELTETTCHFPTEGITEFCGHPVDRGSYCAAHYQICYYPPREALPEEAHRSRVVNGRKFRQSLLKPVCEAA